jgi:hypothetical protein
MIQESGNNDLSNTEVSTVQESNPVAETTVSAVEPSSSKPAEVIEEKTLPQSVVNKLIGEVKHSAYEKAKKELAQQNIQANQQVTNDGKLLQLTQDQFNQLAEQYASQKEHERNAINAATNIYTKIEEAKKKYENYDQVVSYEKLNKYALQDAYKPFFYVLSECKKAGDIIYHLEQNPLMFDNFVRLAKNNPEGARFELSRFEASLDINEKAKSQTLPNDPLSQVTPSSTSMDNGGISVSDFRNKYKGKF